MEYKSDGKMKGKMDADYQPSEKQFAGEMSGKTNQYMERKDKQIKESASKLRSQRHKGRYD